MTLRPVGKRRPNSEAFESEFGVLFLTLGPSAYEWSFVTTTGDVLDHGTGGCGAELDGS